MSTVLAVAAFGVQVARWRDAVIEIQSSVIMYAHFVPECLVGRKEGGCTNENRNRKNDCTSTSTTSKTAVMVTAIVTHHIHHNSVFPNSDTVPMVVIAGMITLVSHSGTQSDDSTERRADDIIITQASRQCFKLRPLESQPAETDWMPVSRTMISLIRASVSSAVMEYPSVYDLDLRKKLVLRSAYDNAIMMITACTKQTRNTNQKRHVVSAAPLRFQGVVYLSMKNISLLKVLVQKLILKFIDPYYHIVNDLGPGNTSFKHDPPSHEKSRGFRDIFHACLLCIHATSDDRLMPELMILTLMVPSTTNNSYVTVDQIRTQARSQTAAVFESRKKSNRGFLLICYIAPLSRSIGISEDDSTPFTYPMSPFLLAFSSFTASFFYLPVTSMFIVLFKFFQVCPFQLLFISPTVDLECRYLHLPYPPADHQQSASINSTQRHWHDKRPGCHSITTSLVSPILTTVHEHLRICTSAGMGLAIRIIIFTSKLLHQPDSTVMKQYADGFIDHPNSFGQSSTMETIDERF